ncbi:hypothetical protein B296_00053404, partial [Ensete ventricosum]
MAAISFARIYEGKLNRDNRKNKSINQPVVSKPTAPPPSTPNPGRLTREELQERSAK